MMNKNKLMMIGLLVCGSINLMSMDAGERLYNAALNENLADVQAAIAAGANLNWRNNDGGTALMQAAKFNQPEIASALITAGADLNLRDNNGKTALMYAAIRNQPEIVSALITAGADLNLQDNDGITALMQAAISNRPEIVRALITAGADLNLQDIIKASQDISILTVLLRSLIMTGQLEMRLNTIGTDIVREFFNQLLSVDINIRTQAEEMILEVLDRYLNSNLK